MGRIAQIIRNELVESTQSPQYLLLRAKGLTRKQSFIKHGLKDSMVTLIPELVPLLVFVINMSFVIEYTYNINGLALYFFESLLSFSGTGDGLNSVAVNTLVVVPISVLLMGTIMIFSLVTDVSLALIDPRISIRSKKTKSNIV
jgi:oligopeptide transport system permease protein